VARFTVDTHLFRELGELLVGRDSTALVELLKNAYDADTQDLFVYGEGLDTRNGFIQITDDGIGMSHEEFQLGFLRIASRRKEEGNRRSLRYGRRYTGAKGIGRLAAHKLAEVIVVESYPDPSVRPPREAELEPLRGVKATIDWAKIEEKQTFDEIDDDGLSIAPIDLEPEIEFGTIITLKRLRRKWNARDLGRFFAEVQAFEPPAVLSQKVPASALTTEMCAKELLFEGPRLRDSESDDPGFKVTMEGQLASGESYWQTLAAACDWIVEIDAKSKKVKYAVTPTLKARRDNPVVSGDTFSESHPLSSVKLEFHARIFVRVGRLRLPVSEAEWARSSAGVRVYYEGFRVLPYGELRNDWLALDSEYVRRSAKAEEDDQDDGTGISASQKALWSLPNANFFGAVFLTADRSEGLQQLINREGFVPNDAYDALVKIVKTGIDLASRVRKASADAPPPRSSRGRTPKPSLPSSNDALGQVAKAAALLNAARSSAATGSPKETIRKTAEALEAVSSLRESFGEIAEERAMLRVLASVGTQLASFIHELNGLIEMAHLLDRFVSKLRNDKTTSSRHRKDLAEVQGALADLRRSLERHASYLMDVVTPDARRRRSRQSISRGFASGVRLVERIADRRGISIQNEIPESLKSPPMFAAELTTVFSNLLTNAIKAVGAEGGKILAKGKASSSGEAVVKVENTGERIDLRKAERWFQPFQSTTAKVDPGLGQGMGLGLTITRQILEENGSTIVFVEPSKGFSTALELVFPNE
jgi:signal transduction histidine kinase